MISGGLYLLTVRTKRQNSSNLYCQDTCFMGNYSQLQQVGGWLEDVTC